ncbi:Bestrophin, RFP-TM, chloride channel-domain-containing protein [Lactarius quietus]|nr:Bestrophin, RFP-TM, chloride channel-domain-containing protein [Lactarius quietus]
MEATQASASVFPDPFSHERAFGSNFWHAILATALFRCWHLLLFFAAWSTAICVISDTTKDLGIASTLLTVIGTVLGFVISYRTTSSFERYNEGRKYWSQIIYASRTLARLIWFHVPDQMDMGEMPEKERKARVLVEKKTVLNLIDAFGVAVKHYLRGEEGIYYEDLYHTTKFLPSYALPTGMPSNVDLASQLGSPKSMTFRHQQAAVQRRSSVGSRRGSITASSNQHHGVESARHLPLPATSPGGAKSEKVEFLDLPPPARSANSANGRQAKESSGEGDGFLLPARNPPRYSYFDLFPSRFWLQHHSVTHNLPLEISLYLSSYIAALQNRKAVDAATISNLLAALNLLVDALTGLERILTTPIPFSYSVHLWTVTLIYCFFLASRYTFIFYQSFIDMITQPFQLWTTLKYVTIPGTIIASFVFFGFLVAGEEIENPFGYDKNDLNLDHFTNGIVRNELAAISGTPTPDPKDWAFSSINDAILNPNVPGSQRVSPEEWVNRGADEIQAALARF